MTPDDATSYITEYGDRLHRTALSAEQESLDRLRANMHKSRDRVMRALDMEDPQGSDRTDMLAGAVLRYFDLRPESSSERQDVVRVGVIDFYPWIADFGFRVGDWAWAITCARSLYHVQKKEDNDGRRTR